MRGNRRSAGLAILACAFLVCMFTGSAFAGAGDPVLNNLVWSEVGSVSIPGWTQQLTVADNTLYVARYDYGVNLFDLTAPANPAAKGYSGYTNPYHSEAVAVQGTTAVVARGGILGTMNVANPPLVTWLGSIALSESFDVEVAGSYAYVADNPGGLRIVDITDPSNPMLTATLPMPYAVNEARAIKVTLSGNLVFVAAGFSGLQIVDVSNPLQPVIIGSWQVQGKRILDVAVAGNYAYLADWYGGMQILDISNPAAPVALGYFDTPSESHGIAVASNVVFLANGNWGLFVIDVTDPSLPNGVATLDTPGYALDADVFGTIVYVADQAGGVRIIQGTPGAGYSDRDGDMIPDSSDADDDNDGLPDLFEFAHGLNPFDAADASTDMDGDGFSNIREYQTGSLLENATSRPVFFEIASLPLPGFSFPVAASGNRVYVCSSRVNIIDASLPNRPLLLGAGESLASSCYDLAVAGNLAYIANGIDGGFRIYDISNPGAVVQRGVLLTGKQTYGVALAGQYIYLADWDGGLRIIDVSNPDNPAIVKTLTFPNYVRKVTISGHYAYVAIGYVSSGPQLRVLDIADPANPVEIGLLQLPTGVIVENMEVGGEYLYLADIGSTAGGGCALSISAIQRRRSSVRICRPRMALWMWRSSGTRSCWPVGTAGCASSISPIR